MSLRASNPYVVGQWVRGDRYYGRRSQLDEILHGTRDRTWLVGTRRAGKTSFLKQLELEAAAAESTWVPVFWDLQGADSAEELALTFHDGLLDGEERLVERGVGVERAVGDLAQTIGAVRSALAGRGCGLLLLCDEVEELIGLAETEPACLGELAALLAVDGGLRVVLCSSPRLRALRASEPGAALLAAFDRPRFLDRLTPDEARALVRQEKLPVELRPSMDEASVEEIRRFCGDHPYLMQLLCRRTVELGSVERAREVVTGDRMVAHFIAVDLEMLEEGERGLLAQAAAGASSDLLPAAGSVDPVDPWRSPLSCLESLALVRFAADGVEVGNEFLRHHLVHASRVGGRT